MEKELYKRRGEDITSVPDLDVFYVKRWQSNGFYPVYKIVREGGIWKEYWKLHLPQPSLITTYHDEKRLLYFLQNNPMNVSECEMKDDKHFNFE